MSNRCSFSAPPTEAAFHCSDAGGLLFAVHAVWGGSFVPRQGLVSQKAPVGWPVHQGAALLTNHVIRGCPGHGDFIFGTAAACMCSGEPFYEFSHARNMRCRWPVFGSNLAIFRVRCQSST